MKEYTAGEFAKKAGVSTRTLRHYDEIGLFKPSARSASGYRLYREQDLVTLQRIMALRYLRYDLQQISSIIHEEDNQDMMASLQKQKEEFLREQEHLQWILRTIERLEKQEDFTWEDMTELIGLMNADEKVQHGLINRGFRKKSTGGLNTQFVHHSERWREFLRQHMLHDGGETVLELDAHNSFWWRNREYLAPGHLVTSCLDKKLLDKIQKQIEAEGWPEGFSFDYLYTPPLSLQLPEHAYDMIISRHLFVRSSEFGEVFRTISKALKPGGRFVAVTVGIENDRPLLKVLQQFEPRIRFYNMESLSFFGKDNGKERLEKYFAKVDWYSYSDIYEIKDAQQYIDFIWNHKPFSNIEEMLSDRYEELKSYLQQKIDSEGAIPFQTDAGIFVAREPIQ